MSRICVIYKIKNSITNQEYIGSSIEFNRRIRRHFKDLRQNIHHSLKLQRSYDKYGRDNFVVEKLTSCPEEYRKKLEQWFLDNNECYYNNEKIVSKPSIGRVQSEEQIEATRQRMLGNNYHLLSNGLTEEGRKIISESSKNRVWTDESRKKLSESLKSDPNRKFYRGNHSEITKQRMSSNHHKKKAIKQYTRDGVFVREWESMMSVEKELGFQRNSISRCCMRKQKHSYGYVFRYSEDSF